MSTTFPTSKQSFTEPPAPTTTSLGDATYAHTTHHTTLGDTSEAVQDKLGYGPGIAVTDAFIAGLWNWPDGTSGGTQPGQDVLTLRRYQFPAGAQFTQLGVYSNAVNTAGSVYRFGIYEDDGTGTYPGALLLDAGVTTADLSTTGHKVCTAFSATGVGGRIVWLGGVVQVAALVANGLIGLTGGGRGMALSAVSTANAACSYTQSGVTGALPGTFTATRAVLNAWPRITYK